MPYNPLNLDPVYGLPSYRGSDGSYEQGDTCANTFTLAYCGVMRPNPALLISADNWPRRSPDESKWYGRANRCSRDQLTPYICYLSVKSPPEYDLFWHFVCINLRSHCFLFANNSIRNHVYELEAEHKAKSTPDVPWNPKWKLPDFLGPDIWAILLRGAIARHKWLRWPLYASLCLLDLHGACAVAITALQAWRGRVDHDQRCLALKTHLAAFNSPTLVSILSFKIYKALKPQKWFESWWSKPGEPKLAKFVSKLFN